MTTLVPTPPPPPLLLLADRIIGGAGTDIMLAVATASADSMFVVEAKASALELSKNSAASCADEGDGHAVDGSQARVRERAHGTFFS